MDLFSVIHQRLHSLRGGRVIDIWPWGTETEGLQDWEASTAEAINLGPPTASGPSTQPLKERDR